MYIYIYVFIYIYIYILEDNVFNQKFRRFCDGHSVYNRNQNLAHVLFVGSCFGSS